jgi:hypothetical protein
MMNDFNAIKAILKCQLDAQVDRELGHKEVLVKIWRINLNSTYIYEYLMLFAAHASRIMKKYVSCERKRKGRKFYVNFQADCEFMWVCVLFNPIFWNLHEARDVCTASFSLFMHLIFS